MIVHIPLNDVVTLTIDITDQMQQDMSECIRLSEINDCDGKDCNACSWDGLEINGDGLCCDKRIIDAVMAAGDNCKGCFGAANGDCDECSRKG